VSITNQRWNFHTRGIFRRWGERAADVVGNDGNCASLVSAQAARYQVRSVAKLLGQLDDPLPGLFFDMVVAIGQGT